MVNENWDEFWWSSITGPNYIVAQVASKLSEGSNVALLVPSDLPWKHSMRSEIQSAFRNESIFGSASQTITIEMVDALDENPTGLNPGKYILKRFADDVVQKGYRGKSKISIQEYILQKDVLKNRIVWVKGIPDEAADEWLSFCKGFLQKNLEDGLFVLEIRGNPHVQETKRLRTINYNRHVSDYDVQLLNSFILNSHTELTNTWKEYLATLAATICDTDAEVSECFLQSFHREEDPIEHISNIAEMPEFDHRGIEVQSKHIFKHCRDGRLDEIDRRVWTAQLYTLFPLIEMERIEIVDRYREALLENIEIEDINQYGKIISDPLEIELGTLCSLLSRKRDEDNYCLYISDNNMRERIFLLHDCRNRLAHAQHCTPRQVKQILDRY